MNIHVIVFFFEHEHENKYYVLRKLHKTKFTVGLNLTQFCALSDVGQG